MNHSSAITKTLLIAFSLLTLLSTSQAGDVVLTLKPDTAEKPKNANGDYTEQVIKQFEVVLTKSAILKKQFNQFETDAVGDEEERGGRYMGVAARGFLMHQSETVDFHSREGELSTCDYTQIIVVFYSYNEGFRRGMESVDGVFAIFEVKGAKKFKHVEASDDHKQVEHKVTATFKGFTKTLGAEKKE